VRMIRVLNLTNKTLSERESLLVSEFSSLTDWESRYERLIDIGKKSAGLLDAEKLDDLKVQGCQAQVWLKAELSTDKKVVFKADSDALITRGLVSLLVLYFSNLTPDEIINAQVKFIEQIGLRDHLSPSRTNGLNAMIKQIKFYGMAYKLKG
jgi:cysteine desulfuration protein SufE